MMDKHLYDKDDVLPFYTGEAISENLREQDGWFGFYNTSTIPAKSKGGVDMDISRVINNKGNCEFIDMYPDRTLFSFVPKYNPYRNRLEYNWDYAITYAFDSTTQYYTSDGQGNHNPHDFKVIQDGDINALATITVEYRRLPNGSGAVFFRSATKHNLHPNDKVRIYFNEDESNGTWHKSNGVYLVSGIGDINHKHEDYYFYITNLDLLDEIFCTPYLCDIEPDQVNHQYDAWDYVRDNFYKQIDDEDIDSLYIRYNNGDIIRKRNVYYTKEDNEYIVHIAEDDITVQPSNVFYYGIFTEYPDQIAQRYNVDDKIYSGWKYYTKEDSIYKQKTATQEIVVGENDEFYYKNGGGLTNIPTETDAYIKVKNITDSEPKYYILFNHDRNIQYDETKHDCESFIEGIINNAFTNNDTYPETNPNDRGGTNTEVNPSMNGLFSDYIAVRFVKTNGNYDCSYYVRKFKQVPDPNIVFGDIVISDSTNTDTTPQGVVWIKDGVEITGTREADVDTYNKLYLVPRITDDGSQEYSQYITVKSVVGDTVKYRWERRAMTLDNETYPVAFSNTIYGDPVAQTTFTDNINVKGLKDNLGRDLSEVFLTIVKSNRGYKKWYGLADSDNDGVDEEHDNTGDQNVYNDPDIEYSHCFGAVTCGFELSKLRNDTANIRDMRSELIDVTMININNDKATTIPNDERYDGFTTTDIEISDNWFYGDIVELCPWTCIETPISDVCFRFNTAQRENSENGTDSIFGFDEIISDDYDDNFVVRKYDVSQVVSRDEGYYYKAHYKNTP